MKQYIFYNETQEGSLKQAEIKKAYLENKGFNLLKTEQYALNKFCLNDILFKLNQEGYLINKEILKEIFKN